MDYNTNLDVYDDSMVNLQPIISNLMDDIGIPLVSEARTYIFEHCMTLIDECDGYTLDELHLIVGAFYSGYLSCESRFLNVPIFGRVNKQGKVIFNEE
jgi:hypothetical protein